MTADTYLRLLLGAAHGEARARLKAWTGESPKLRPRPRLLSLPHRRLRVLVVSPIYPYPPQHGAAVRIYELLRRLGTQSDLHLLLVAGGTDDPIQRQALGEFTRGIYFHLRTLPGEEPTTEGLPESARPFHAPLLGERIRSLVAAHGIDVVQLESSELAGLADFARPARATVVEYDVSFRSYRRRWVASRSLGERRDSAEWLRWYRYELDALERVDQIQVMSEEDGLYLAQRLSDGVERIRVVPNGATITMAPSQRLDRPEKTLLFLGSFPHLPNAQGLRFFVEEIWPLVRAAAPDVRLLVCGSQPPAWVRELDGQPGIEVAGEIEDVAAAYQRSTVMVVPLLSGSGTRVKVLEALAAGLPVVSTRIGAEGLDLEDGRHLLLADGAKEFAEAVLRLVREPVLRRRLAKEGHERVAAEYDWSRIAEQNLAVWQELSASEPSATEVSAGEAGGAAAAPGAEARIAVIVPLVQGRAPAESFLDALAAQNFHLPFSITIVTPFAPAPVFAGALARRGFTCQLLAADGLQVGQLLDRAIVMSRAEVLAVLDPRDAPCSPRWLGDLVWSQLQGNPPSVVSGEVLEGNRHPSSREEVAASTGFAWKGSNFAFRRPVWEAFPFGPGVEAMNVWRRQIDRAGWFVFSSPDAPVRRSELRRAPARLLPAECHATVVICTRQRGASLEATVRSLMSQKAPFDWEALIVDNGSRDGSLELARRLEQELHPRLRVVEETTLGLSAARNRGILAARGERIVFLDDDALPLEGWLAALVGALDENGVLAAGGPIDPLFSGERPVWLADRYLPYLSAWDRGPEPHDLFYNELPRGTNMAFRREAFERFGEFSRHLGRRGRSLLSCEETELGLRLERGGGRIRYAPAARVQHRIEGERLSEAFLESRFAAQGRSEAIVDWMHGGWSALRAGLRAGEERSRQAAAEPGAAGELHRRCQQASARAYRREILRAILSVPRYRFRALGS